MPHCRPTMGGGAQALAMDVPSGLIRVETAETLQGYVLVVPGSPEHTHYAGSTRTSDSDPVPSVPPIGPTPVPTAAKRKR